MNAPKSVNTSRSKPFGEGSTGACLRKDHIARSGRAMMAFSVPLPFRGQQLAATLEAGLATPEHAAFVLKEYARK
jgi:hypothetical protein